jgi:hypothetical protein
MPIGEQPKNLKNGENQEKGQSEIRLTNFKDAKWIKTSVSRVSVRIST